MKLTNIFLILIISCYHFPAFSQSESIISKDSLVLNDSVIDVSAKLKLDSLKNFDSLETFKNHWDIINLFPYSHPVASKIPDSLVIALLDSNQNFQIPYLGKINSKYGWRGRRIHRGVDIKLEQGDSIVACFDGKVRYARYNSGGYGNLIIIRHFNGLESYYSHLKEIKVKPNDYVKAGDFIGTGGNTGAKWSGAHLHWELRWKDYAFDPEKIVDLESGKIITDSLLINSKLLVYEPTSKTGKYHIVKKGDTLTAIARKHRTSIGYLCALNNINRNSILHIGQKIILP
jgi:murein DD-endopeptidase MepM/ murein hydrolase activator NlpD